MDELIKFVELISNLQLIFVRLIVFFAQKIKKTIG
jgi:hypothetical protein